MMTVIDQAKPWLTPSSALAAITQPQLGAQMIMNGTGRPNEPAEDQDPLAAPCVGELPGDEIGEGLDDAEADDEGDDQGRRGDAEFFRADQRHDGALDADHAADEGVDQHEQRELAPVGLEPKRDRCALAALRSKRRLGGQFRSPEIVHHQRVSREHETRLVRPRPVRHQKRQRSGVWPVVRMTVTDRLPGCNTPPSWTPLTRC